MKATILQPPQVPVSLSDDQLTSLLFIQIVVCSHLRIFTYGLCSNLLFTQIGYLSKLAVYSNLALILILWFIQICG